MVYHLIMVATSGDGRIKMVVAVRHLVVVIGMF
jgi:hypothetical protein